MKTAADCCTVQYMSTSDTRSLDDFRRSIDSAASQLAAAESLVRSRRSALVALVRSAIAAGLSELEAAALVGVSRMTIRRWIGKE
jgi:Homeodomain-like domain